MKNYTKIAVLLIVVTSFAQIQGIFPEVIWLQEAHEAMQARRQENMLQGYCAGVVGNNEALVAVKEDDNGIEYALTLDKRARVADIEVLMKTALYGKKYVCVRIPLNDLNGEASDSQMSLQVFPENIRFDMQDNNTSSVVTQRIPTALNIGSVTSAFKDNKLVLRFKPFVAKEESITIVGQPTADSVGNTQNPDIK